MNNKMQAINYALDGVYIWDMSVEEIQDTIYKMFKNDKTKWLFVDIEDYKELDNLVIQYLEKYTNYFENLEE